MRHDTEVTLRAVADHDRRSGNPFWDEALRHNGLDPARWSDGTSDARFADLVPSGRRYATPDLTMRAAELAPASFDAADSTVDLVWTTGADVRRISYRDGPYIERLVVSAAAIRLGRLNAGAPFLNAHASGDLADIIGAVVPRTARLAAGLGHARVKLSADPAHAGIVANIRNGVIRNVSVGYAIHAVDKREADNGTTPVWRVTDWEPFEISAVPIPADAGAQIRAATREPTIAAARMRMAGRAAGIQA